MHVKRKMGRCALFGIHIVSDLQKHTTMKSQLEAQELENKNVKDVRIHLLSVDLIDFNQYPPRS